MDQCEAIFENNKGIVCNVSKCVDDLMPHGECFPDNELVEVISWLRSHQASPQSEFCIIDYPKKRKVYRLSIGVILRAYSGIKRVVKRSLIPPPRIVTSTSKHEINGLLDTNGFPPLQTYLENEINSSDDSDANRMNLVVRHFTSSEDHKFLDLYYPPSLLFDTAYELTRKLVTLSPDLLVHYHCHPLHPRNPETNQMVFNNEFLIQVKRFHEFVRRPEGTYDTKFSQQTIKLAELERGPCPVCGSSRQIYCGDCGGIPLPAAKHLLPEPISLPFDITLLIHWQESLHKCTGMHARALCKDGHVSHVIWPRIARGGDAASIIRSLDPSTDVLLFPSPSAIPASSFSWESSRKRLIVLEASWGNGKTMANQISAYREEVGLDPIPCVALEDVVGQYWRFQREGNHAVSTIEAISHTAVSAGLQAQDAENLLSLFYVQKYRVLGRVSSGGMPPQAIRVQGSGLGSWEVHTSSTLIP